MNTKALLATVIFLFICLHTFSQSLPNREFRGVWVATVSNLDWPVKGASAESQKAALRTMLDKIKEANLNAVLLQVRTECDAFYSSSKEPWSRYLTGKQGVHPGFDPLDFAIDEAHKRGLELHAWINPYRVNASTSTSITYAPNHIINKKQNWLLNFSNGKKIINPGLPEVREYIASVVQEIAENYEIDGIHFDDYFYPYPEGNFGGITTEDSETFAMYGGSFTNIKDWRRNNINETIRLVSERLSETKPGVRFGVSPFGIWKSGVPSGITGMDAYNTIYADPIFWLEKKYIDYLTPQLYWQIGGAQDYKKLLEWWSGKAYSASRHLYAGHAIYKTTYSEQEIPNQISISRTRQGQNALGNVLYRATNLSANTNNLFSNLKNVTFKFPAAPPEMVWKEGFKPVAPDNLMVSFNESTGDLNLTWERNPANSETFKRYILYNLTAPIQNITEIPNGSVRALTSSETFTIAAKDLQTQGSYWAVTELSPENIESDLGQVMTVGNVPNIAAHPVKDQVSAYPNPTKGRVFVDIELKRYGEVKADLVSLNGRSKTRVLRQKYSAGSHTITIERGNLKPGTYLLILYIDRTRSVKRVILN